LFDLPVNDRKFLVYAYLGSESPWLRFEINFFFFGEVNSRNYTHELDGGRSHFILITK